MHCGLLVEIRQPRNPNPNPEPDPNPNPNPNPNPDPNPTVPLTCQPCLACMCAEISPPRLTPILILIALLGIVGGHPIELRFGEATHAVGSEPTHLMGIGDGDGDRGTAVQVQVQVVSLLT